MIRVLFRQKVAPEEAEAFVEAWTRCKDCMLERDVGATRATLYRSAGDPGSFVSVTEWKDEASFRSYWEQGRVKDPEGEPCSNEVLVEVRTLGQER